MHNRGKNRQETKLIVIATEKKPVRRKRDRENKQMKRDSYVQSR